MNKLEPEISGFAFHKKYIFDRHVLSLKLSLFLFYLIKKILKININ